MDFNIFTYIFLAATIIFLVVVGYLNNRQSKSAYSSYNEVPQQFSSKIPLKSHQKAARYTKDKLKFSYIEVIFSILVMLLWTLFGGINILDGILNNYITSQLWLGVWFIISFIIISSALEVPFSWYKTFNIEERFNFNKMTKKIFIIDLLKQLLITLIIGIPLVLLVIYLMNITGEFWWFFVWLLLVSTSFIAILIYPKYIAPIFNKFKPLDDKELNDKITLLLKKTGFNSDGIFVMDGSKHSSHGNAYFSGMGKNKRIVFFDTLLENLSHNEVLAVLAHELGHFHHKHIRMKMLSTFSVSLIALAVLGYLITQDWFYNGLGITDASNYKALIAFLLISPVFTFFISPITNSLSRKHEYEADNFAAKHSNSDDLISALVSLYKENASILTPDKYYSLFYDSHPSATLRINNLCKQKI